MLLPITCAVCGVVGASPCPSCEAELLPPPAGLAPPAGVDRCWSLMVYEGAGRELVARLKYRNRRASLGYLAAGMADLVRPVVTGDEMATWVPTTPARRRRRGFDQAELLARAVSDHLDLPCRRLLRRAGAHTQTGHSLAERLTGPRFTALRAPVTTPVLVIDDVCTSGATLAVAAKALRSAGAPRVDGLTAARALRNRPTTTQGGRPV